MNLIVETDIGHDPDDFFALCYLISQGVKIRAILISPGDQDQIAITRFLCHETGLDIPIGVSKPDRTKRSSGSIHHHLLRKYGFPLDEKGDGLGSEILTDVLHNYPDSELFICGPVSSIGKYLLQNPETEIARATMQGGYLPYSLYRPQNPCVDFEGREWMPTFNLNGDRPSGVTFLTANIKERRLVGKNICHTVVFQQKTFEPWRNKQVVNQRAWELFNEAAELYFIKHEQKKFHDPTAAVLHLHPEIGTWFRGNTIKQESGWTTWSNETGDFILADIDYTALWRQLL